MVSSLYIPSFPLVASSHFIYFKKYGEPFPCTAPVKTTPLHTNTVTVVFAVPFSFYLLLAVMGLEPGTVMGTKKGMKIGTGMLYSTTRYSIGIVQVGREKQMK